ncbi:MAG: DUF488 domain-containing protein [Acidiphilium sp.]|nr:DUF488 domain-containing protein [Acidiphilium sp.]MDD4936696.1 DUF488 domain-containing protein [Acidiphilium sp.]
MTTLSTIGYEKCGFPDFLTCLQTADIGLVIDVRDLPLSRRAGFSKRQLGAGLEAAGIRYVHLRALGTPPDGREANRRRQWERFWAIVEERLDTPEAELALHEAADLARQTPACLLCYEAEPCICHRRRIAEILAARHGFAIRHLRVHE